MRVAHVITRLIVGGAQENTIATVNGLRRDHGIAIRLFSGPTHGSEGSLVHQLQALDSLEEIPHLIRPVRPASDRKAFQELRAACRRFQPDIVHTHSGKAGVLGRLAAHRERVPIIVHSVHGPSFGKFQGPLANLLFRTAEACVAKFTTHFVSVADAMTDQYVAAGIAPRARFTTIPSGFDVDAFRSATPDAVLRNRLGISKDDVVIGKIARLFELKGHDELISAAPEIVAQCPRAKFLLIGDGDLRPSLQQKISKAGLQKHFVFAGLVSPQEVASHVALMDLLVHLSRREGLPRALPQALAAGKPVVAIDCDGASEVCLHGKTGFLIPLRDHRALVQAVITLSQDAPLRKQMGQAGQDLVCGRFRTETMVQKIFNLYTTLLAQRREAS